MYRIDELKCNHMRNPMGLTDNEIVFSWKLESSSKGIRQVTYQIKVWKENGDCVWDSSEQKTEDIFGIRYEGQELESHHTYSWQVISVSNNMEEAKSQKAYFTIGMLDNGWKAKWMEAPFSRKDSTSSDCTEAWKIFAGMIKSSAHPEEFLNPPAYFRKEISISKNVKKALLYATARGIYQIQIDGTVVTELLAPGHTNYDIYMDVGQHDVSKFLTGGRHALGIILADGWYTGKIGLLGLGNQYGDTNAVYLQLEVFFEDGTRECIVSDDSFSTATGGYEYADLMVGERFNAALEPYGWNYAGYHDEDWHKAVVRDYDTSVFRGRRCEPVNIIRSFPAKNIYDNEYGELILDAGENIAGFIRITMEGTAGTLVRFQHTETLDQDGRFYLNIEGQNKNQEDIYLFGTSGETTYEPKFTFHGFRYIRVIGISKEQIKSVEIKVIGNELDVTGNFRCSDERLNKLQENILRSQQSNMISIPMDCPQRERAGWTGDMQIFTPTACFNMNVISFLSRWLSMMQLEQLEDGQIPHVIPQIPSNKYISNSQSSHISSSGWGDACILVPYVLYKKYGDIKVLTDNYQMMDRWMNYVERQASTTFPKPLEEYPEAARERQKYLWNTEFHFGDWLFPSAMEKGMGDPISTAVQTKEYASTAMYAYTTSCMEEICRILGDFKKADYYKGLNINIREAFDKEYIDKNGYLNTALQGIYVLTLQMKLCSEENAKRITKHLVELIHENDDRLDTGFLSVPFLLDVLCDNGESELAYTLLKQTKCPSWLYEVEMGATTIWESWKAISPDGTPSQTSLNHFAFGCVGDFIYRKILGLNALEPAYHKVLISPDLQCGLSSASGVYDSMYGKIYVMWKRSEKVLNLDVVLPVNVSGVVRIDNQEISLQSGSHAIELAL